MTSPAAGVCGWSADVSCCPKLDAAFGSADPDVVASAQSAVDYAAALLYGLSGRQFGVCPVTVRPCREGCGAAGGGPWTPTLIDGRWYNLSGSCAGDDCGCCSVCEIVLPGPVDSIVEVLIDGAVVPPTDYRVDNYRSLVRTAGECWPDCQDLTAAPTEPGTWQVTYMRGIPLDAAGQRAVGRFACELFLACVGDSNCCLPARAKTVVRQGITMDLLDPMEFLTGGRTGIYEVDLWLSMVNPNSLPRSPAVLSPDMPQYRRPGGV